MATENEVGRKFKVNAYPENLGLGVKIVQGFVEINPDGTEIHVKRSGSGFYFSVKPGDGLQGNESEVEITEATFKAVWPLTENKRIEKTRYAIELDERMGYLDIYSAGLLGLAIVEVKFTNTHEAAKFIPPTWFTQEVTSDKRYQNQQLALNGLPR